MKLNIKEIGTLINEKEREISELKRSVQKYTPECLSIDEAKESATNNNTQILEQMATIYNDIFKLQNARAYLNANTSSGIKDDDGNEYTLLEAIMAIKNIKDLLSDISYISPDRRMQTLKRLDSNMGKIIFSEYNGDANLVVEYVTKLNKKIVELQNRIDYLNVSEYTEVDID